MHREEVPSYCVGICFEHLYLQRVLLSVFVSRGVTWSQSRNCPLPHCVCWTDDHTTAEHHHTPWTHTKGQEMMADYC